MGVEVVGYSYPPRLLITAQSSLDFTSPKICVEGLDRKCGFNLFIPVFRKGRSRKASVHDMSYYAIFLASSIPGDESATKSKVQEPSSAAAPGDESATTSKVQEPSSATAQS